MISSASCGGNGGYDPQKRSGWYNRSRNTLHGYPHDHHRSYDRGRSGRSMLYESSAMQRMHESIDRPVSRTASYVVDSETTREQTDPLMSLQDDNTLSNQHVSSITVGDGSEYCASPFPSSTLTPLPSHKGGHTATSHIAAQSVGSLCGPGQPYNYQHYNAYPAPSTNGGLIDNHGSYPYQMQQSRSLNNHQYRTISEAEQIEHILQFCGANMPNEDSNRCSFASAVCTTPSITLGGGECILPNSVSASNHLSGSPETDITCAQPSRNTTTIAETSKCEVEEHYDGVAGPLDSAIDNPSHQCYTTSSQTAEATTTSGQSAEQSCYEPLAPSSGWYDSTAGGENAAVGCGGLQPDCSSTALRTYRIQYDQSPNILKRHTNKPVACYRQHISVRYLQPPAPPPPGPIIIKEVRGPEPPPAPPIIVRQKPREPKTPPPLVLREKPPPPPCVPPAQVLVKRLPPPPPPPRQVVIERYPPLPPKPRDIIIEKWLPYQRCTHRPVILQKAPQPCTSRPPKNVIIQYIAKEAQIDRVYRQLGVVQVNPCVYVQQHCGKLMEPAQLQATAMKEGIAEAIKAPFMQQCAITNNQVLEYCGHCNTHPAMYSSDMCQTNLTHPLSSSMVELTCPPDAQVSSWLGCVSMQECLPCLSGPLSNSCACPPVLAASLNSPSLHQASISNCIVDGSNQQTASSAGYSHPYIPCNMADGMSAASISNSAPTMPANPNGDFNHEDWNFLQDPY